MTKLPEMKVALKHHDRFRDWIYDHLKIGITSDQSLFSWILLKGLTAGFNTYKTIGIVLPEQYYEAGNILLRNLWECSLTLHFIERDPENRSGAFVEYTIVEFLNLLPPEHRAEFEKIAEPRLEKYRLRAKPGRIKRKLMRNWSGKDVAQMAQELGPGWIKEYRLLYRLGSQSAHAAPGALLFTAVFDGVEGSASAKKEEQRTATVALSSILTMRTLCRLFWKHTKLPDGDVLESSDGVWKI